MSRVTDEELADLLTWNQKNDDAYMTAYEARQLLIELKERRAADLTTTDVTALGFVHGLVRGLRFDTEALKTLQQDALFVLDRLLSNAGGDK